MPYLKEFGKDPKAFELLAQLLKTRHLKSSVRKEFCVSHIQFTLLNSTRNYLQNTTKMSRFEKIIHLHAHYLRLFMYLRTSKYVLKAILITTIGILISPGLFTL